MSEAKGEEAVLFSDHTEIHPEKNKYICPSTVQEAEWKWTISTCAICAPTQYITLPCQASR